jgi:molecular chaperone IbpA
MYIIDVCTVIVERDNMIHRKDDYYPPRPEKDWDHPRPKIREPKVPQDPRAYISTPAPKPLTIADLFPRIDRWGIGLLDELTNLKSIADSKPSYPPYNITKDGNVWEIALALAGFRKHELEVEVQESTLTIRTNPATDFEGPDIRQVVFQGIAQRNFELKFALAEHVEVKTAEMKDGILSVKLEQKLPKEKQPKAIEIL